MRTLISLIVLSLFTSSCGVYYGRTGPVGATGAQGPQGSPGADGVGCTASQVAPGDALLPNGGAVILCGEDSVLIANGSNGLDGADGEDGEDGEDGQDAPPTAFAITGILNPCGDAPGIHDELMLVLGNGMIIALVAQNASGLNPRLAQVTAGTWQTTDGDACIFTITAAGVITYQNHTY